jgi:transcriptional antiterminator RfaH
VLHTRAHSFETSHALISGTVTLMTAMDPPGSLNLRWYVVQTKPGQESRAEANLRSWGVETLSPRLRERRPAVRSRAAFRIAPLFPRYLFARFDATALLAKVRFTRGVHDVVGFGEHATAVDDDIIALVRGRVQPDGLVRAGVPHPRDLMRVPGEPMRSLIGIFEREMEGHERVLALLTTVVSQAGIQIDRSVICSVSSSES